MEATNSSYDIEFFWDPICPFAWITSRWIEKVVEQTGYSVDWRFISLRILNKDKDYDTEFPAGYEVGHTSGLRFLRAAAHAREELGKEPMSALYSAFGTHYWDLDRQPGRRTPLGTVSHTEDCFRTAGLPTHFAASVDDQSWDHIIETETETALERTGRDVGTPIISFKPPEGLSFFGPVLSRVPDDDQAVPLWNAVIELAGFPGFAEMKRSLREVPQINVLGSLSSEPAMEDWETGARKAHKPA